MMKALGFYVLNNQGYEGKISELEEARRRLVQPPVKQKNHFPYCFFIAANAGAASSS